MKPKNEDDFLNMEINYMNFDVAFLREQKTRPESPMALS